MQAVGLHPDVFVVTSRFWQTTCTLVKSGEEAFCVDSPGAAGRARAAAGDRGAGRRSASSAASRRTPTGTTCSAATRSRTRRSGCAESSAARLRNEPGAAQRELRDFDEEHYVERPGPADAAGGRRRCRCPGTARLGERELELHPADGHTVDGMAVWVPWASVLVCGDYLSPVEIPWISAGGSASAYLATLDRLEPLVERAAHVVPGHGAVLDSERALAILREDRAYLSALLEHGADAPLPLARRNGAMRKIHAENAARVD